MKLSIDQSTDFSRKEIFAYLRKAPVLPDYVKEAEFDEPGDLRKMAAETFAAPVHKRFPVSSKARTYVSNAFFQHKKATLGKVYGQEYVAGVDTRIKQAADLLGITKDLAVYNHGLALEKKAAAPAEPICVTEHGGHEFEHFHTKNAEDFRKNAEQFVREIKKFPFGWREKIASSFVEKAAEFGVDEVPDLICKYAGMFYPDVAGMESEIRRRAGKVHGEKIKGVYEKLAESCADIDCKEDVMKMAEICELAESEQGLYDNPKTASLLPDPVSMFFALPIEKVAKLLDYVEMGGEKFAVEDLKKVGGQVFEDAFGIKIAESEFRDVLPTMPLSDVRLFKEISGIRPIGS